MPPTELLLLLSAAPAVTTVAPPAVTTTDMHDWLPAPPVSSGAATAAFRFAAAVGSGMVLAAAPKQAVVWGFCEAGASVDVVFRGQTIRATVAPDHATGASTTWRALLPATGASFEKHSLEARSGGRTLRLSDVLFGEVWVCSGQSNMQYPLGTPTCWNATNVNCSNPHTKQCSFGCRFSATCWFFGRDLYSVLSPTVPIGLIESDVGGTPDEHWSSPDAIRACDIARPWGMPTTLSRPSTVDSVLWNAMVVGLLRTTISGVAWYQGENNAAEPRRYSCSFPAMIEDWRAKWHALTDNATARHFPFGWAPLQCAGLSAPQPTVQCASPCDQAQLNSDGTGRQDYTNRTFNPPHPPANCGRGCAPACSGEYHEWGDYGNGFTGLRYAQSAALRVRNTFQAVIIDTPVASGSIHSPFKQPELHAVDPIATGAVLRAGAVEISVGGLGRGGLMAEIGARGFEVLGNCSGPTLCWMSSPISAASADAVTLSALPAQPQAVRYLWYIDAVGVHPFRAPIYTKALPLPGAPGIKYGNGELLPLGPFLLPL
ncbi:hypothetical protein EMIHUDRAFT_460424 [Emiliania huxleyi CCMP1516]|uniref:Sialate O-acetylesterase domain-containing protein n=2 Tax=Emiliania huxleyi TaxID=2903 RepID=A0A0D3KT65_EMIH1|nr:hypothetical protein EMIHUDRAFT_460424 [Emiliania huxleyi CCMP1516]EOD38950.1 hypothetical protein EMIHUDRAFT_460424 [Emiliania huxleyi CCMP1516]|eukprot:XP_005791379.1 hypothetical protein EMIHUDRAFT_460424 [Emiliania huxleyi CCMP1516]